MILIIGGLIYDSDPYVFGIVKDPIFYNTTAESDSDPYVFGIVKDEGRIDGINHVDSDPYVFGIVKDLR